MEAPAEIKVKTRKFSLTKGTIKISFELEGSRGRIRSLKLKQRNAVLDTSFPFEMQTAKKKKYDRVSCTDQCRSVSDGNRILGCGGICG